MRVVGGRHVLVVLALVAGALVAAVSTSAGAQEDDPTCFGEAATIVAVAGKPTVGTAGDDVIVGTAGADDIRGGGGDDVICGLAGPDVIRGNAGADRIRGGPGRDRIYGGKGRDLIVGGSGADELYGNSRADTIRGNRGKDEIWGGKGYDTIDGGAHGDTIRGNQRNDAITGGGGHDTISGGKGDDTLAGEAGHDIVLGKTGDDALDGGEGHDTCQGGSGDDTAVSCETTPLIWEKIDPGLEGTMRSVIAGGPGLVAVGDIDEFQGVVWLSEDGRTWEQVNDSSFGTGDRTVYMDSVTVGGPGLVAVGSRAVLRGADGDAAVWVSENGSSWDRVKDPSFRGPRELQMLSVAAGGPGLVAAGFRDSSSGPVVENGAVWVSADGLKWDSVTSDSFVSGGLSQVVAGGPGLVMVGGRAGDAAVWVSADGLDWTRVRDKSFSESYISGVTVGGPGLVAIGSDTAWVSTDGLDWERVSNAFPSEEQNYQTSIAAFSDGVIAVGWEDDHPGAWRSHDGRHWQRLELPGGTTDLQTVTAGGPGVVAIAHNGDVYLGTLAPLG